MAYDAEKQMLRELIWLLLGVTPLAEVRVNQYCIFCHGRLLKRPFNMSFGHRRHPKVWRRLTVHHLDENRENNLWENLVIVHTACHRKHHKEKRT